MTVRLRSHHLLCLLTYVGKGYSAAFIANYDAIAKRLGRGEDVLIVSGPDDICQPMLGEAESHCSGKAPPAGMNWRHAMSANCSPGRSRPAPASALTRQPWAGCAPPFQLA